MKHFNSPKLLTTLIAVLLSYSVAAQQAGTTDNAKKPRTAEQIASDSLAQKTALAIQMASEGLQSKSAVMLISAAQLSKELKLRSDDTVKGQKYDAYSLLVTAQSFTKDKNLTGYIKGQMKAIQENNKIASKGNAAGPKAITGNTYFSSNESNDVNLRFTSGYGRVTFTGTGASDFDLYIFDESGNLIAKDDDYSAYCVCSFYLDYSQNITIRFVSRRSGWWNYTITTN